MKILFQGDSITDAKRRIGMFLGRRLGYGYVDLIAKQLKHEGYRHKIVNRGIAFNRTSDLLKRWQRDSLVINPDVLSLLVGINDSWHGFTKRGGVSLEGFEENYRKMLMDMREKKTNVKIILGIPYVSDFGFVEEVWAKEIPLRGEAIKKVAREFSAYVVDYPKAFESALKMYSNKQLFIDGVHPTKLGHEIMANVWLKCIKENKI
ncbi:MAG: SGNH/GDSL hydrolase family protein [Fusobacteria bacterium]|nr:SGNH/GDSL hydrolase family protein [Fusobacteriota bacterium]